MVWDKMVMPLAELQYAPFPSDAPLAYHRTEDLPLAVGTDHRLESRIVWLMLKRYGLLNTCSRYFLRSLSIRDRILRPSDYSDDGTPYDTLPSVLRLLAWRRLWPVELFSLRTGAGIYRAAMRPGASSCCRVRRTLAALAEISAQCEDQTPPAILLSAGSGDLLAKPVFLRVRGNPTITPLGRFLDHIDQVIAPEA